MAENKQSRIAAEYREAGYDEHYNAIDIQVVAETECECGAAMTYIALKKDRSYIAIAFCPTCGEEYQF